MQDEKSTDYFIIINKLKEEFELKTGLEPTHLIVGIEDYYKIENSQELLDRLKYIKDTSQGVLGSYIIGLRIIKSINFKGIKVAYLL